ncbi:hypothetical protein BDB00DRAFT_847918 [Zychaea mexicana]|uniref:uncharacterized protein n=1 Tax=Zychaea mexicana TaxID=64656 RepID=UPI0022FEA115|nr:uncharacterized protein BDB00DRAFT_847918 [Zychaea mexicana]KAI9488499.1 hypothetical protein BDB00DRAFT_847918 [Zychaea mexicana]
MQTHFDTVFSLNQLLQIESHCRKSQAPRCLYQDSTPIFLRFPHPRQPSEFCSVISLNARGYRSKSVKCMIYGTVYCHDYQTVEAVWARLQPLQQRQPQSLLTSLLQKQQQEKQLKVAKLLLASFPLESQQTYPTITNDDKDPKPSTKIIIVIDIGLKDDYMCRACQLPSLSWSRRMWALASRANMISFTGVCYSVLGGAYSSLSKANANYAYKAGSLAIQQIKFAQWLKDPVLESKCWLYYAEDLIQLHRFKRVDKILAKQVAFAQNLGDPILLKMCDSVQTRRDRAYADHVHAA